MTESVFTPPTRDINPELAKREAGNSDSGRLEAGLGAWASAVSGDDNAQAAIALAEAINRARNARVGAQGRAADARVIAVSRLETLRARLAPVYAAVPRDVELFDLGLVGHNPPRLFVDIIAFVEMGTDRNSFRLVQETRAGRVLLGETADERRMTELVTNYIAERLVEREMALAAQGIAVKVAPLPRTGPLPDMMTSSSAAAANPATAAPAESVIPMAALSTEPVLPDTPVQPPAARPVEAVPTARPVTASAAVTRQAPAPRPPVAKAAGRSGGWIWPLLSLVVGVGLGALLLYLYAANLARP